MRVDRRQVAREAAHHPQPLAPVVGARVDRLLGPHHRQLGRDSIRTRLLQEVDEVLELAAGPDELEAELAADPQVVAQHLAHAAHAPPPGHGSASGSSDARSTFA